MNWATVLRFRRPTIEKAFADCRTPRDICQVIRRYVRTKAMLGQVNPPSPIETWRRGYGDCDDIAFLVHHVCRQHIIHCDVLFYYVMNRKRDGHALVQGLWCGSVWCASNADYFEGVDPMSVAKDALGAARLWWRIMT